MKKACALKQASTIYIYIDLFQNLNKDFENYSLKRLILAKC